MADKTKVEWADATWSPMTGCTPISEGCEHCYAERMARRFNHVEHHDGYEVVNDAYFAPTFHPNRLDIPLHWRKPRRVFVCSMSDLFHEAFTDEQRLRVFARMDAAGWHTFMVLTKRPGRMHRFMLDHADRWTTKSGVMLPNVWLGVTAENQQRADERIPILLDTPAAVRFVSVEPMLGPISGWASLAAPDMWAWRSLDWVILGGETGPGARPMQPEWALDVYRQCRAARVPFFFKQAGTAATLAGSGVWFEDGGIRDLNAMSETREFPAVAS